MDYYQAKTGKDFQFIASLFKPENTEFMLTKKADYKKMMKSAQAGLTSHFIATLEGKKIAWFNLSKSSDLDKVSFGMIVDKSQQGKGYGQEIMKIIEKEAKNLGVSTIRLAVFEDNIPAVYIYKKAGFKEIGRLINMEKEL